MQCSPLPLLILLADMLKISLSFLSVHVCILLLNKISGFNLVPVNVLLEYFYYSVTDQLICTMYLRTLL